MPFWNVMEKILIGKIVNVHGINGEVKVYSYTNQGRFNELDRIILEKKNKNGEYEIVSARDQGNTVLLKLKGVNDRNTAESLRDYEVYITEDDLGELPEDEFYIRDLIGCSAINAENGAKFGEIAGVIQYTAQDTYEIKLNSGKMTYIPAVKEFVKEINIEAGEIRFNLIPGFVDDAYEV